MSRLRYNNQGGGLVAALTGTTITFGSVPSFATIVAPDIVVLELEPGTPNYEIVYLTAYTAGAATGTVLRGQEGTTQTSHAITAPWVHGPTALDFNKQYSGAYSFFQSLPAATWNIPHALHAYPSVTVIDSAGGKVVGDVTYVDDSNVTIRFSGAFSGTAHLN